MYDRLSCCLPGFVSYLTGCPPEKLYKTETYGTTHKTVFGKRAKKLIEEEELQKVVGPDAKCCSHECLRLWKGELGLGVAEAIIRTEVMAYASMRETGRQQHFMIKLKECAVPVIETASNGSGKHITGTS